MESVHFMNRHRASRNHASSSSSKAVERQDAGEPNTPRWRGRRERRARHRLAHTPTQTRRHDHTVSESRSESDSPWQPAYFDRGQHLAQAQAGLATDSEATFSEFSLSLSDRAPTMVRWRTLWSSKYVL